MIVMSLSRDVQTLLSSAEKIARDRGHKEVDVLHVARSLVCNSPRSYIQYLKDRGLTPLALAEALDGADKRFLDEEAKDSDNKLPYTGGLDLCLHSANEYRECRGSEEVEVVDLACGLVDQGAYLGKNVDLGDRKAVIRELQALQVLGSNPELVRYIRSS